MDLVTSTPQKTEVSSHNSTLVVDTTFRGQIAILAQQIDQEIQELRNVYEDNREEMLSLNSKFSNDLASKNVRTASAGCSPIIFESSKKSSPKRSRHQHRKSA